MVYFRFLKVCCRKILVLLIFGYQQVIQKYLNTGNFPIYGIYAIVFDAGLKRENDKRTTYTQNDK